MTYTAYGDAAPPPRQRIGFNGEYFDAFNASYGLGNGYRYYSPTTMRFLSTDSWSPFGEGGINTYGYCKNDPINNVDPTGHRHVQQIKGLPKHRVGPTVPAVVPINVNLDGRGQPGPGIVTRVGPTEPGNFAQAAGTDQLIRNLTATPARNSAVTQPIAPIQTGSLAERGGHVRALAGLSANHQTILMTRFPYTTALTTPLDVATLIRNEVIGQFLNYIYNIFRR